MQSIQEILEEKKKFLKHHEGRMKKSAWLLLLGKAKRVAKHIFTMFMMI